MAEKISKKKTATADDLSWPFGTKNYIAFGVALLVIAVGYILLGQGSITAAPVLLVLGYCVLIPVALIIKGENKSSDVSPTDL